MGLVEDAPRELGGPPTPDAAPLLLPRDALQRLVDLLRQDGWRVLGPVPRDGAVVLDEIERVEELPLGLREVQEAGRYRLEPSGRHAFFDVVNGPGSLKPLVFAPREPLLQIELDAFEEAPRSGAFRARELVPEAPRLAVLGVRACDLAALAVQDRIFLEDREPDAAYAARRRGLLLVGVSCTRAAPTCFCVSFDSGPGVTRGHDLALTELAEGFVARAGSAAGESLLGRLAPDPAPAALLASEEAAIQACAASQRRSLAVEGLPERLWQSLEHPRWRDVGARCLSCGNCTMVCPTCFCHDVWDEPALEGGSLRVRAWDSCFDRDHAQVRGLNHRPTVQDRYRQWLTHKLAGWVEQYGTSGCVGCGRCITWCPVGIDLTEEVAALEVPPP